MQTNKKLLVAILGVFALALLVPGLLLAQNSAGEPQTQTVTQAQATAAPTEPPAASAQTATKTELFKREVIPCPGDILNGQAFTDRAYAEAYKLTSLQGEVEGKTIECGIVTVPENYSKPDGRTIELMYLRLFSTAKTPAEDPLVYLSGGPGISGTHEVSGNPMTLFNLNKIREQRDIVTYDQRGTGYSNFLLCAPFSSAVGMLLQRNADPKVKTQFETILGNPLIKRTLHDSLCAAMYDTLTDVDLSQYNSVVSAQDIKQVANALGYTKGYNLYGTSYGTRLSQYAMRTTPDQVRSVILDGAVPPEQANATTTFAKRYEQYLSIFAQCAADSACNAAYPNLKERFAALVAKIDKDPIKLNPPLVVHPNWTFAQNLPPVLEQLDPSFFVGLAGLSNQYPNGGPANMIPRTILALEKGDLDYVRQAYGAPEAPAGAVTAQSVPPPVSSEPAFKADQPLFQAPFSALLALAQVLSASKDTSLDTSWISIVLNDLQARLLKGEDQVDLMGELVTLSVVPNAGVDGKYLVAYANEHLSPAAAQAANAVVAQMSHSDVRKTMWGIQDIAMQLGTPEARTNSSLEMNAVNCAEDIAFTTPAASKAYLAGSPFPQLLTFPVEVNDTLFKTCEFFPKPLDKSISQPVKSDIPTLVFQQALDVQTPVSWAQAILKNMTRGYYVEWPNMGHVAAGHDYNGCSGEIAVAFLQNPGQQPNTSCMQDDKYKLKFVLPGK